MTMYRDCNKEDAEEPQFQDTKQGQWQPQSKLVYPRVKLMRDQREVEIYDQASEGAPTGREFNGGRNEEQSLTSDKNMSVHLSNPGSPSHL